MERRTTHGFVLSCAVLLAALMLSACIYRSEEFRYRMTVVVDTPQGLRTGSSVIEVEVADPGRGRFVLPEMGTTAKVRGEAVAVDLPGGKILFALLDGAAIYPYQALKPARYRGEYALIERTQELKRIRGVGALRCPEWWYDRTRRVARKEDIRTDCPILVHFRDLGDPRSVERVDPADLAATFGEGVSLRRIAVQITNDPVTTGIAGKLGWLIDPAVMGNPGWGRLPLEVRTILVGLRVGKVGSEK